MAKISEDFGTTGLTNHEVFWSLLRNFGKLHSKHKKMGRLKLVIMVVGGMLAWMGVEEFRLSKGTTQEAVDVDLAALENGTASITNPHVRLGDHVASYWDCIYSYSQSKYSTGEPDAESTVNHVYYPVLSMENPYLAEVAAFREKYQDVDELPAGAVVPSITKLAMLLKTKEFRTIGEIPEGMVNLSGIEGLIVNEVESLASDEIALLQDGFPGFEADKVLLLEVGRKPASKVKSIGMVAGGGVIALLGFFWLISGFRKP